MSLFFLSFLRFFYVITLVNYTKNFKIATIHYLTIAFLRVSVMLWYLGFKTLLLLMLYVIHCCLRRDVGYG